MAGESTDDDHKGWIEILSYSHAIRQPVTASAGRAAARGEHEDFTVVKPLDKSSPTLALYTCNGRHIPSVTLDCAGPTPWEDASCDTGSAT